jgi:hypothetical protein
MIIERQQDVTIAAMSVMEQTSAPRLREIMVSLVKHLHGFIRDIGLTEAEFREAAAILVEIGKRSTDTHNEAIPFRSLHRYAVSFQAKRYVHAATRWGHASSQSAAER